MAAFALVFPGQGSQSLGMMQAYGDLPVIRATFDEASAVLGEDLWSMMQHGPAEVLNATVNTQPLMLAAGVAVFRAWVGQGGAMPAWMAGHSLGEYSALVAAEALGFGDAVRLVRLRAQAMQAAVPEGQGAMAAVMGLDDAALHQACQEAAQGETVAPVNFNSPGQTVIAGSRAAVERACDLAKAAGAKRALLLPVSVPSHCALMQPAAEQLRLALEQVAVQTPRVPVLHNADVRHHDEPAAIRAALVAQLYSPVRWVETMRAMADQGVTLVAECGPGKVLAGLGKRCDERIQSLAMADAAGLEQLKQAASA